MIFYQLNFPQLASHYIQVQMNINGAVQSGQRFQLPNWIPGSYMIRDFSKNLSTIVASCKDKSVAFKKVAKSEWELMEDVDCLQLEYRVYAWDLSVRTAHADLSHVFFNGSSLFLSVKGREAEPHHLKIEKQSFPSTCHQDKNWILATTLPTKSVDSDGFGHYIAENYEALIDHPVEIGPLQQVSFDACGINHTMVFTEAPSNIDLQRIARDVKAICETEIAFWGDDKPPFDRYLFMTLSLPAGFGGLEHRSSTALHCSHKDLPLIGDDDSKKSAEYRVFLSLCAHEYFHSWNVKRLKPTEYIAMDLSAEVHTEMLWFFEGITSYYDELFLPRAGVITHEEYFDLLAKSITRVEQGRGQYLQSLADSSFDAWTKFYKQDENAANAIVSYYTKGAMAALYLDFHIRTETDHRFCLDDLMRHLWQRFGKNNIGINEALVIQACKECFGLELSQIFQKLYHSTEAVPVSDMLSQAGIKYALRSNSSAVEKGGYSENLEDDSNNDKASLGIKHKLQNGLYRILMVHENSTASELGLSAGDDIVAVNGLDVRDLELDKVIATMPVDSTLEISFFKRGKLCHGKASVKKSPVKYCQLQIAERNNSLLNSWLKTAPKL